MTISVRTTKCYNCGSILPYEVGRKKFFCSFCGSQIVIPDGEENDTLKTVQSANKSTSSDNAFKMRQLELIAKETEKKREGIKQIIKMLIVLAIIGGILLFIGINFETGILIPIGIITLLLSIIGCVYFSNQYRNINTSAIVANYGGKIRIPEEVLNGVGFYCNYISGILRKAGFTNVKCIPISCLGIFVQEGQIESIKVGNYDISELPSTRLDPDTSIVINYYSQKKPFNIEIKL